MRVSPKGEKSHKAFRINPLGYVQDELNAIFAGARNGRTNYTY